MKPNILYSYEEWFDRKNTNNSLSKQVSKLSENTAQLLLYAIKSCSFDKDSQLTNEETIHKEYLEKSSRIRAIEMDYTDKTHQITFLYNSLSGKYGRDLAPIYTKIGKLKCELIKIENECKNIKL